MSESVEKSIHVLDDVKAIVHADEVLESKNTVPPYVSLYLPVNHTGREGRRDDSVRIQLKDLRSEALKALEVRFGEKSQYEGVLAKIDYIIERSADLGVWKRPVDGVAILISNDDAYIYPLDFAPEPVAVVGDHYYLKPLIKNLRYAVNYGLIALSTDRFGFLKGGYRTLERVAMPEGVHSTLAETYATFDGVESALDYYSLEGHFSPYHLYRSRNDVVEEEREKFFRYVDGVVKEHFVADEKMPLILVGLPEHQAVFRKLSTLDDLLDAGIEKDPASMNAKELCEAAFSIFSKLQDETVAKAIEAYGQAQSQGHGSDDPAQIGSALVERKVDTLFVAEGKGLAGEYNVFTGEVFTGDADIAEVGEGMASPDLIDAFAQRALLQDTVIYVLPMEKMPTKSPVAAIYRY